VDTGSACLCAVRAARMAVALRQLAEPSESAIACKFAENSPVLMRSTDGRIAARVSAASHGTPRRTAFHITVQQPSS